MNKAEEQYLYEAGKAQAKSELMNFAKNITLNNFKNHIREELESAEIQNQKLSKHDPFFVKGLSDYNSEILRLIYSNVITDWPSFVTYMTGETYDS